MQALSKSLLGEKLGKEVQNLGISVLWVHSWLITSEEKLLKKHVII